MPASSSVQKFAAHVARIVVACASLAGCGLGVDNDERLARGEAALASGDSRTAVIDSKTVLQKDPDNVAARMLLGRASLAEGNGVAAEKELRRAVELGADSPALASDIARALLLQGKHEALLQEFDTGDAVAAPLEMLIAEANLGLGRPVEARERFSRVLAVDGTDELAQLGVARSYLVENNVAQARATLQEMLGNNGNHVPTWLFSAQLHQVVGDFENARIDFERARALAESAGNSSGYLQALFGLAETSFAIGDLDTARRHTLQLDEIAPNTIAALQATARLAMSQQEWSEAQQQLTEILRRAPENNFARTMLGAVHLQAGNLGQAEMYLSAAVANEPANGNARRLLAEARLRLNKAEEAEAAIRPMLEGGAADPQSLAIAARVSFMSGDFASAAAHLERSARENPASADVQLDLAAAYLMAGRVDEALQQIDAVPTDEQEAGKFRRDMLRVVAASRKGGAEAALSESASFRNAWPGQAMANIVHGAMLASSGRQNEARAEFVAALEKDDRNVSALRFLGQLEASQGDDPAAAARFERLLEIDENDIAAMLALAGISVRSEDSAAAAKWLERARSADATAILPRLMLGQLYANAGEFDKAGEISREAIEIDADVAEAHNALGMALLGSGDTAAALRSFERAVDLDDDNRAYVLNLARALGAGGDFESASSLLESKAGDDPLEHVPTGMTLAITQARAGSMEQAMQTAARLRERHPDNAAPIALQAELHVMANDWQRAVEVYDDALDSDLNKRFAARAHVVRKRAGSSNPQAPLERFLEARPLDIDIRLLLANHYHQEDEARAMREYRRIVEQSPDNFVATNNLAWLYLTNEDPRAEELARKAYAMAPKNGSVADTLGWVLFKNGKLEEAVQRLREAVQLDGRPEVHYHLAAALAGSGEVSEARQILENILEADGDFQNRAEAQELLTSL